MPRTLYDVGYKFPGSRLTVLENILGGSRSRVRCKCDCGQEVVVFVQSAKRGATRSCGCLRKEKAGTNRAVHGLSSHRLYFTWYNIKDRCGNPKNFYYARYGGRGVSICPEWSNRFETFYAWANESGWKEGLQIDRIDNDGNYEPSNCRFVPPKENSRNRSTNAKVSINGIVATFTEHSEVSGIKLSTLKTRYKLGWRGTKLLTPVRHVNAGDV